MLYRERIKNSLIHSLNTQLGICEQLRNTYDSVVKIEDPILREEITEKLVDVLIMAKKMGKRLSYYWQTYHDETGHKGSNLTMQQHNRAKWKMRRARI